MNDEQKKEPRTLTLPLIGGDMALLYLPLPITQENYDHLLSLLDTMRPGLLQAPTSTEGR